MHVSSLFCKAGCSRRPAFGMLEHLFTHKILCRVRQDTIRPAPDITHTHTPRCACRYMGGANNKTTPHTPWHNPHRQARSKEQINTRARENKQTLSSRASSCLAEALSEQAHTITRRESRPCVRTRRPRQTAQHRGAKVPDSAPGDGDGGPRRARGCACLVLRRGAARDELRAGLVGVGPTKLGWLGATGSAVAPPACGRSGEGRSCSDVTFAKHTSDETL